jgi:hypothetical protein
MRLCWTLAARGVAGYGLATAGWHLMILSVVVNCRETAGGGCLGNHQATPHPAEMLGDGTQAVMMVRGKRSRTGSLGFSQKRKCAVAWAAARRLIATTAFSPRSHDVARIRCLTSVFVGQLLDPWDHAGLRPIASQVLNPEVLFDVGSCVLGPVDVDQT